MATVSRVFIEPANFHLSDAHPKNMCSCVPTDGWQNDDHQCHQWWLSTSCRHQMETFSALLALCEGNPSVTGGFPSLRTVTRRFDVFFDLRLNEWLSKQSRRRWFETPSHSSWRHCNEASWQFSSFSVRMMPAVNFDREITTPFQPQQNVNPH